MKKTICKYAVVRFAPFSETDEFANIGVLLYSAESNFFDFKLGTKKCFARVSKFFRIVDSYVIENAITSYESELAFLREEVLNNRVSAQHAFEFLVKPRATLLQFSNVRTAFTNSPSNCLMDAFNRTVLQNTENIEKARGRLQARLRDQLDALQLENPFKQHKFSKFGYEASMAFTQLVENVPSKVIQPIDLSNKESVKELYKTVGEQEVKLSRLEKLRLLPKQVLITYKKPNYSSAEIAEAWRVIESELKEFADIANIDDKAKIQEFALMQ